MRPAVIQEDSEAQAVASVNAVPASKTLALRVGKKLMKLKINLLIILEVKMILIVNLKALNIYLINTL